MRRLQPITLSFHARQQLQTSDDVTFTKQRWQLTQSLYIDLFQTYRDVNSALRGGLGTNHHSIQSVMPLYNHRLSLHLSNSHE